MTHAGRHTSLTGVSCGVRHWDIGSPSFGSCGFRFLHISQLQVRMGSGELWRFDQHFVLFVTFLASIQTSFCGVEGHIVLLGGQCHCKDVVYVVYIGVWGLLSSLVICFLIFWVIGVVKQLKMLALAPVFCIESHVYCLAKVELTCR